MIKTRLKMHLLLLFLVIVLSGYLIWWDNLNIYSGYYNIDMPTDIGAIIASALIVLVFIFSVFKSIKNREYLWIVVLFLLLGFYFSRLWHGPRVAKYHDVDFSVCYDLSLYADGSYYFCEGSQVATTTEFGSIEIKNDTLFLKPGFHFSFIWKFNKIKRYEFHKIIRADGYTFNGG